MHRTREEREIGTPFLPSMAPVRRDQRFAQIIGGLGLERHWRESGTRPDDLRVDRA